MRKHSITRALFLFSTLIAISLSQDSCETYSINASSNVFPNEISQTVFGSPENKDIYILSGNDVFYSEDGREFTSIRDELEGFDNTFGTQKSGVGQILNGVVDKTVYFVGASHKIYWMTRGEGVFKSYEMPENSLLHSLLPHPTQGDLILRLIESCNTTVDDTQSCKKTLEISETQGTSENSWQLVRDYVFEYDWGTMANQIFLISVPEERMNGVQMLIPIQERVLYGTRNLGESFRTSPEGVYYFKLEGNVLFVAQYDVDTQLSDLFLSTDGGETYTQAKFNNYEQITTVDVSHFMILSNEEGVSFLSACNNPNISTSMDMYQADLSDIKWSQYWLNFPHTRGDCINLESDFQVINSMPGVFITNAYDLKRISDYSEANQFVKSAITFDKGGVWSSVAAPPDSVSSFTRGESLNLFGKLDGIPPVFSTPESFGLVIANGNEGRFLNVDPRSFQDDVNVYFSRNGGLSWEKIMDHPQHYAISQHGSLITAISYGQTTTNLQYSWDQGKHFSSCSIFSEEFTPTSLKDASYDKNTILIVEGTTTSGNGFFSLVDFSESVPRTCSNLDTAGESNSDYEIVQTQQDNQCLLGGKYSLIRRKKSSECISYSKEITNPEGVCECTREDFTCDGDCWKESLNEENLSIICVNACEGEEGDPEAPPEDCPAGSTYMKPSGYRKIQGDICERGENLEEPIETDCPLPSNSPTMTPTVSSSRMILETKENHSGMSNFWIFFIITFFTFGLLLLSTVTIIFLYKTNPSFHNTVNSFLPASLGGGSGGTKQYSVLGDIGDASSLFGDDDLFLEETQEENETEEETGGSSLLEFDEEGGTPMEDIEIE